MIKIKDLKHGKRGIDLIVKVVEKPKAIVRGGKLHSLAVIEDETGKASLNLWRDQVNQVEVGDVIKIQDAFVRKRWGILQVSTWSKLIVLNRTKKK